MKFLLILAQVLTLYTFKAPFAPPDTVNLNSPNNLMLEVVRTKQSSIWTCCMWHHMHESWFQHFYPRMRQDALYGSGTFIRTLAQGKEVTIDLPYGYYRHRWCTHKRVTGNWIKDTCGEWSEFWRVP